MTGFIVKKYYIAVLNDNLDFIDRIVTSLKHLYKNKVIIKTFNNSLEMFEAINIGEVKDTPFDLAILGPNEYMEKMILKQSNPNLKVVVFENDNMSVEDTDKLLCKK